MRKYLSVFLRKLLAPIRQSPYRPLFGHGALMLVFFIFFGGLTKLATLGHIYWTLGFISIGYLLLGALHLWLWTRDKWMHQLHFRIQLFSAMGIWFLGWIVLMILFWKDTFFQPILMCTPSFLVPFFITKGFAALDQFPKITPPIAQILEFASVKEVDLLDRTNHYIAFKIGDEQLIYSVKSDKALDLPLIIVFKILLLYRNYNDKSAVEIPLPSIANCQLWIPQFGSWGKRYLDPTDTLRSNQLSFKRVKYDSAKKGKIEINLIQIFVHPILNNQNASFDENIQCVIS